MIIVGLAGGLGNQLFQYAAGLALALRVGTELKVDVASFTRDRLRTYDLGHLVPSLQTASRQETENLKRWKGGLLDRAVNRAYPGGLPSPKSYFEERGFSYDPEFGELGDNTYIKGYWQSYRYFDAVGQPLRSTLEWPPADRETEAWRTQIEACDSVSVHIRRGDYVQDPRLAAYYEECSTDYYQKAMKVVVAKCPNAIFFVFSDQPDWVRSNWNSEWPVNIVSGSRSPWSDLGLMAACKHHIIANSTFSWWGAWLNPLKHKTVVAPRRWFRSDSFSTVDLLPGEWTQLGL
jgi:hypothetical protein